MSGPTTKLDALQNSADGKGIFKKCRQCQSRPASMICRQCGSPELPALYCYTCSRTKHEDLDHECEHACYNGKELINPADMLIVDMAERQPEEPNAVSRKGSAMKQSGFQDYNSNDPSKKALSEVSLGPNGGIGNSQMEFQQMKNSGVQYSRQLSNVHQSTSKERSRKKEDKENVYNPSSSRKHLDFGDASEKQIYGQQLFKEEKKTVKFEDSVPKQANREAPYQKPAQLENQHAANKNYSKAKDSFVQGDEKQNLASMKTSTASTGQYHHYETQHAAGTQSSMPPFKQEGSMKAKELYINEISSGGGDVTQRLAYNERRGDPSMHNVQQVSFRDRSQSLSSKPQNIPSQSINQLKPAIVNHQPEVQRSGMRPAEERGRSPSQPSNKGSRPEPVRLQLESVGAGLGGCADPRSSMAAAKQHHQQQGGPNYHVQPHGHGEMFSQMYVDSLKDLHRYFS